jgi:hypothetical protein
VSDSDEVLYVPLHPEAAHTEPVSRVPFDLSQLAVKGLVIVCELDDPAPGTSVPTMTMKMTQYLRLSDESMIRLDIDRGLTTFMHSHAGQVSWKQTPSEVISEVLTLIQGDEPDPGSFPWDEYAQAAQLRGISVTSDTLRGLPHTVLLSDDLTAVFEF